MKEQASAIRSHWVTNWGTTTPTYFENENFSPPDNAAWARLRIRPASATQVTIGENVSLDRHTGIVHITIFCPPDTGDAQGMFLADKAVAIFRKLDVSTITFRVPWIDILGTSEGWWSAAITCPYWYEELT